MKLFHAGLGERVTAFAFDYIIITGYLFFIVAIGLVVNMFFPTITLALFSNPLSGQMTGFLIITLPVSLYFILCEASTWQATWGKQRKGLQVIRVDGAQLTILRSIGRTALKFIPWELAHTCIWQIRFAQPAQSPIITVGFVLVWVLIAANIISLWISSMHQTLYDRLAGTYVVKR